MRHKYDISRNNLAGYSGLGVAVILQAIIDWRSLCNGGKATNNKNFSELKYFFKNDADIYLAGTNMLASEIYAHLEQERVTAMIKYIRYALSKLY